jgi:hypothetical protein
MNVFKGVAPAQKAGAIAPGAVHGADRTGVAAAVVVAKIVFTRFAKPWIRRLPHGVAEQTEGWKEKIDGPAEQTVKGAREPKYLCHWSQDTAVLTAFPL